MSENRKLATVCTIKSTEPIVGADRIVLASMNENSWKCIVGKDTYNPGDRCVYIEIDSVLPDIPFFRENKYLVERKFRIKSMRMKGVLSQGYVISMADAEQVFKECGLESWGQLSVGSDVTGMMKITQYEEPEVPVSMGRPKNAKTFPSFIAKTDEQRVQSIDPEVFRQHILGKTFLVSVKADGTSGSTFYNLKTNEFGCCSRNLQVYSSKSKYQKWFPRLWQWLYRYFFRRKFTEQFGFEPTVYYTVPKQYGLEEKLPQYCRQYQRSLALQGEIIGEGIQSNRENVKGKEYLIFNIWDIDTQKYLLPNEVRVICDALGMQYVPVVQEEYTVGEDVNDLLALAEGPGYKNDCREGIVLKSLTDPNIHFKVISNTYLIKHGL